MRTQRRAGRWLGWAVAIMAVAMVGLVDARTRHHGRQHVRHQARHQRSHHVARAATPHHRRHGGGSRSRHRSHAWVAQSGGLHPMVRARLSAALLELRRRGLRPRITSTYRSTGQQRQLFRCAQSRRCRLQRGVYGAKPPGHSTHEAGLAVDIAGIAAQGRGHRRRLTGAGATIVRVMRRHDFNWRYGLRDPAHFELSPRRVGFRDTRTAIHACRAHVMVAQRHRVHPRLLTLRPVSGRYRARGSRPWAPPRA